MSKAMRPAIWVASQWNSAPASPARSEISPAALSTPVSLLAAITDTSNNVRPKEILHRVRLDEAPGRRLDDVQLH